ncbi:HNH endonuclease [Achromobacter aegrifaciens]
MSDQSIPLGAIITGEVTSVGAFFAFLCSHEYGEAYVNIAQLRHIFTPQPLSDHLKVGDQLSGVCIGRESKTLRLEISPKRAGLRSAARSARMKETLDWVVEQANEFTATLTRDGVTAQLVAGDKLWSRYRVLYEAGLLAEGAPIAAQITADEGESGMLLLYLPNLIEDSRANPLEGTLVLWRLDAARKKDRHLRNILYVHTSRGMLYRVECNNVVAADEHFAIGQRITIVPKGEQYNGIETAHVHEISRPKAKPPITYPVGTRVVAKVISLMNSGAKVLVDDYRFGYLPAAAVLPGKGHIGSVIQIGDFIEGKVAELGSGDNVGSLSFERLIQEGTSSVRGRDPLVDIKSQYAPVARGGYGRNASFRLAVTEVYGHACCMCGNSYRFQNSSAMEAAHIIPRGRRGADHVSNGLCMCPIHHWAFDRGLIAITHDLKIAVARTLASSITDDALWLTELNGRRAALTENSPVSLDALRWHYENIFAGD